MKSIIPGIHHVTATVGESIPDLQFYTQTLGLRLVKKTVNFDNRQVYHFYYGDRLGNPGTIMTTFPYAGQKIREGVIGTGQVGETVFSIPAGSASFWEHRLQQAGISVMRKVRFGQQELTVKDPSGLNITLTETDQDQREPWTTAEVEGTNAIRGIHSATLWVKDLAPTAEFLVDTFGWQLQGQEGDTHRFSAEESLPGKVVDVRTLPELDRGKNGLGTVHHLAFQVESDEAQLELRDNLLSRDFKVTEQKDRKYFRSIYFRMPGGVLFEVATMDPGFPVDETEAELGTALKLPEWEEPLRPEIEAGLPEIAPW
ncbi:MAG: ring-cleaving dioxygenase [Bacteroidota bacterium]